MDKKFSNRYFSLLVIVATFVVLVTTIPDVLGYSFVGVTTNGVEFPILSPDVSDDNNSNSTGTGDSVFDGLGVYMTIQNIGTNGKVYFGSGNNPGEQTDIRQYVGIGVNDDWVIAIDDNDVYETLFVPEFGVQYTYVPGSLVNASESEPNILGYTTSQSMSGTNNIRLDGDGIHVDGTGIVVIKLNNHENSILVRGTLNNADVKFVTSPINLTTLHLNGNDYAVYENFDPSKTLLRHDTLYHFEYATYPNILIAEDAPLSAIYEYNITHVESHPNCGKNGCRAPTIHHHGYSGTLPTSIISENTPDGTLVTKLQSQYSRNVENEPSMDSPGTRVHRITSPAPWNEQYSYNDTFEQNITLPENSYMIVTLHDGSIIIKGETFDPDSDIFFQVKNLPADIAYDVSKSGIIGAVGKTSSTGTISLLLDDVDFGLAISPGGILTIYPNSTKYIGNLGIGMIDLLHKVSIELPIGEDLVYIPQNYVYWVFPRSIEVENLQVDSLELNYLNRNYTQNEALYIPVIPGADIMYATINGEDVEILMKDVATTTQITQVPQESSSSSNHAINGAASTSSNISVSTFETATHTGTMSVNFDFKVGGSVDFTMDSAYTGGFTEHTSCRINYSTERLNRSCNTSNIPNNPDSISNMVSLTAEHQEQLTTALNNGQVSQIAVEVDIVKNMQYVDTILIYTSNFAEASITSTMSEAGYNARNQVYITYPLTLISENISIPVTVGDMMEFVVRVNLEVSGAPAPSSKDARYSSYVQATTEFGGGVITVGMS